MRVSGHAISFFNDGLENANNYQWWGEHPPGPGATPCWSFPRPGWLGQVTCALGSSDDTDQILCNSSMDHFDWSNVKEVGVAVFRDNREIKIPVYAKGQTSDLSWEFLRKENKQIKTVQKLLYKTGLKLLIFG